MLSRPISNKQITSKSEVMVSHHKMFHCGSCQKSFRSKNSCLEHRSIVHENKLLTCQYCGRELRSKGSLRNHIVLAHTKDSRFKCPVCDKVFISSKSYEGHMNMHRNHYK